MVRKMSDSLLEISRRVKTLENINVVKVIHDLDSVECTEDSDVNIFAEE